MHEREGEFVVVRIKWAALVLAGLAVLVAALSAYGSW
jgi:hypothetical protein